MRSMLSRGYIKHRSTWPWAFICFPRFFAFFLLSIFGYTKWITLSWTLVMLVLLMNLWGSPRLPTCPWQATKSPIKISVDCFIFCLKKNTKCTGEKIFVFIGFILELFLWSRFKGVCANFTMQWIRIRYNKLHLQRRL